MSTFFLLIIPTLFCLLLVWLAARLLISRSWLLGWLRGTAGLLLLSVTVAGAVYTWGMRDFTSVRYDQPLAVISFSRDGSNMWQVEVTQADGDVDSLKLAGDLWFVDADYLGLKTLEFRGSMARMRSVKGRFLSLEKELGRAEKNPDYARGSLIEPLWGLDSWQLLKSLDRFDRVTADIVPSSYSPMVNGGIFEVYMIDGQIDVKGVNAPARKALKVMRPES